VIALRGIHAFHRTDSPSPEVSTSNNDSDVNT